MQARRLAGTQHSNQRRSCLLDEALGKARRLAGVRQQLLMPSCNLADRRRKLLQTRALASLTPDSTAMLVSHDSKPTKYYHPRLPTWHWGEHVLLVRHG